MRVTIALLMVACLAADCGCRPKGPQTAPVGGKVTYAGKPVTEGTILFWSTNGATVASGQLGPDGSYRLTTHPNLEGAALGSHRVTIRAVKTLKPDDLPNRPMDRELKGLAKDLNPALLKWLVPKRYEDRQASPLTAEVKPGQNTIDFNLPADK
jgi:hypothetical protein